MSDRVDSTLLPSVRRWMFGTGLFAVLPMLLFSVLAGRSRQQAALHAELRQQADFGGPRVGARSSGNVYHARRARNQ